jgi:hypothetical protein
MNKLAKRKSPAQCRNLVACSLNSTAKGSFVRRVEKITFDCVGVSVELELYGQGYWDLVLYSAMRLN